MITKVKSSFMDQGRGYFLPEYYDEEKISEKQRRKLVEYICSLHNDDKALQEQKISQLEEFSFHEADDLLHEVSKWQ